MKKLAIPVFAFIFMAMLMQGIASAQSTGITQGPDTDVTIVCDSDYYTPDPQGFIDIYCDITNKGGSSKNEKVGAVFDDWMDIDEVEFIEVETKEQGELDYTSIKNNLDKSKPLGSKNEQRTKQLSQQNIQTRAGETTQVHFKIKVPLGSSGKFDIEFGGYVLDPWWNVSWQYKACYNLSGHTQNLTGDMAEMPYGYPFNLTINTQNLISGSKMQSDCDDIVLVYNDSEYVKFFTRDCGSSTTEVWGAWNFTVGESYDFCVYYGNPSASNNETNATDIVFEWQDFDDSSAFNWSEWSSRSSCQSGGINVDDGSVNGTRNAFYINDTLGTLVVRQPSGCSGNSGSYIWRNDTSYNHNVTLTGIYTESTFKYTEGCGVDYAPHYPVMIISEPDYRGLAGAGTRWDTSHYSYPIHNMSSMTAVFLSGDDYRFYFVNDTGTPEYYHNSSNYYTTRNFFTTQGYSITPNSEGNYNYTMYADYNQPFGEIDAIWTSHPSRRDAGYMIYNDFANFLTDANMESGFSFGTSKGCNGGEYGWYDYIFARPMQEGEPIATGGAEVPLDNGTLSVDFDASSVANGTTVQTPTTFINVTANKTIEWCKLDWDGANYTMDTDTEYCYLDKSIAPGYHTYKVWVEDYWGYEEVTSTRAVIGSSDTALLGVGFDVSDVQIESDTYVLGATVDFNTSLPETNLILMSSMNLNKTTNNGSNVMWVRVKVDGNLIAEEILATLDEVGEETSAGLSPTAFNVSAGSHNVTLEFKRTGNGIVMVNDIDASMGQFLTTSGGVPLGSIESGNFSHTSDTYASAYNFTLTGIPASNVFMAMKITASADNYTRVGYAFQNLDNLSQISPYGMRYMDDADEIVSMAGSFIAPLPSGDGNFTVLAKNFETGRTTDVNFTAIWFTLKDNFTKEVGSFQVGNASTNDTDSINISDSWTMIANATQTVNIGDGYFLGMYVTANSPVDNQTVSYKINATGVACESKKDMFLENGNDYGLAYIWFICDGLTPSSSYDFELWAKAETGMWFDHYDESFAGFEVQSFDIASGNIAPYEGSITEPENGSVHYADVNITWTEFSDPNGNFDDYNVTLWNDDWTFNQTLQGSTTDLYYEFDTGTVPDASYYINVEGCDTEPLCTNTSVFFSVQSLPEYTEFSSDPLTTDFTAVANLSNVSEPVLANTNVIINWSGYSGFNVQGQNLDYGINTGTNYVYVNSTYLTTFDQPAIVTMRLLSYPSNSYYRILKDGSLCTDCVKVGYDPVQFTVTGFSNYTVEGLAGIEGTLTEAGSGLGSFLSLVNEPIINLILALGVIGGVLAVFYGIGSVIRRALGGATQRIGG